MFMVVFGSINKFISKNTKYLCVTIVWWNLISQREDCFQVSSRSNVEQLALEEDDRSLGYG